jgi:hypothetical protein
MDRTSIFTSRLMLLASSLLSESIVGYFEAISMGSLKLNNVNKANTRC